MPTPSSAESSKVTPKGESLVWFTGLGLAVGILLILGLLGVILKNGLSVFWPKTIYAVELKEGSGAGPGGQNFFAGAVALEREKRIKEEGGLERGREYQFFVGNKDVYGQMYHFVDADEIRPNEKGEPRLSPAEAILRLERMEFGDALGYPVEIRLIDGTVVPRASDEFDEALFRLIEKVGDRRAQYTHIEEKRIGAINRKLEEIRLERRELRRSMGDDAAAKHPKMDTLRSETEALQSEYEKLAAQARELRERQHAETLVLELTNGEEKSIAIGEIVHAYYPNELGFLDKVGFFFHQIWRFVTEAPREANTEGGIFPAIFGTFVMTLIMSIAVMPFGVIAAIYLREYASQGFFVRAVRISVNNLAGVPSIVYGVFGLGFFVYVLGGTVDQLFYSERLPTPTFGTGGILWASLTLALMTVPVVIVATEEALSAVPRGMREASLACGASKWQTIQRIILPASAPGILTGMILAMARGAGEVAPLMLVGVVKLAPTLPVDGTFPFVHLERKFMHLGFHIYDLGFQSPDSDAAKPMVFATTLLLIVLVVVLNLGAITIRNHLRKKYRGDTF